MVRKIDADPALFETEMVTTFRPIMASEAHEPEDNDASLKLAERWKYYVEVINATEPGNASAAEDRVHEVARDLVGKCALADKCTLRLTLPSQEGMSDEKAVSLNMRCMPSVHTTAEDASIAEERCRAHHLAGSEYFAQAVDSDGVVAREHLQRLQAAQEALQAAEQQVLEFGKDVISDPNLPQRVIL